MKKLRMVSTVALIITVTVFILWRTAVPLPDWLVRINGVLMLAAIFTVVLSTVIGKKKPDQTSGD